MKPEREHPTPEQQTKSLPVQNISHYRVIALLGQGGMGEVYLAEDKKLGRKVALKVLPVRFTKDKARLQRFEQEARTASSLNHPNIITIYAIDETTEGRFLAMEYVEGQTLRALDQPLRLDSLVRIGAQIAKALHVAHAAGIIHRDIKPENIMVRSDGYVKVLDFGLARLHFGDSQNLTMTGSGIIAGTPRYMSPEQMRGDVLTTASDLFSFGIVLYELATSQNPGTPDAIASHMPTPPSRLNYEIPAALDSLILQMLSKDSQHRPTASEVEDELERLLKELGTAHTNVSIILDQFVGRDKERIRLDEALASVKAGSGTLLCVSGESGIGKTMLVEEFVTSIQQQNQPCRIARGRCSERLAGAEAYLPWLEALDSMLRSPGGEAIARVLKRIAPRWYLQLVSDVSSESQSPVGSQELMKRELAAFLQEMCRARPLLLFFDDVQWSDASTVDLLAFVATKFEAIRILVIATYRHSELLIAKHPFLQLKSELQSRRSCHEIQLDLLSAADIERYLSLEFPGHRFSSELSNLIYIKTDGSPLFMVELVRYLREREVIAEIEGAWTLVKSVPEVESDLPESMRAMIARKIEQLKEEDRRLLIAASVQGNEFDSAVIGQVLELDPAEIEDRLEELERIYAFVRSIETKEFPDHTLTVRYRFTHILYQNALYALLRPTRKAQLSAAVAQALLKYYGKQFGSIASELAKLFEAARDFSNAVPYYLAAAKNASEIFAYKETVTLAGLGLDLLKMLPESPQRIIQELDFHIVLGPALAVLKGYAVPEVEKVYERALELCRLISDTARLFTVQYNLWLIHDLKGDMLTCRKMAEECLEIARNAQDSGIVLMSHAVAAESFLWYGEFHSALTHGETGASLYDIQQHRSLAVLHGGYDQGVVSILISAHALWFLGYPEKALNKACEHLGLAEKLGDAHTVALALIHFAFLRYLRREIDEARKTTDTLLSLATDHGLPFYVAYATAFRGRALVEQGKNDEGISQMYKGITNYRATGSGVEVPFLIALLAEACGKTGRSEEGIVMLDEMLTEVDRNDLRFYEAELNRLKGELLLQISPMNIVEAEAYFHRAIAIAGKQDAKSLELRAATSLCRLWHRQGKNKEAREILNSIYGWFNEGSQTADLREAKTLIEIEI